MKNKDGVYQFGESFEKQVFEALKFYGYKLPKSKDEIDKYVRMFGNTQVELPESLMDGGAIFDNIKNIVNPNIDSDEIWAIAARGDMETPLPEDIVNQIKHDIKEGKWLKHNSDDN
jgi:hypothetical protein